MARENHHPFPNTFYIEPLETWADSVQRLSSAVKQCFPEKVVHYKALSGMEHEFLVVYASNLSGSEIVLGIDRYAQRHRISRRHLQKNIRLSIPEHGHNSALNCGVFVGTVHQHTRVRQGFVHSDSETWFLECEVTDTDIDIGVGNFTFQKCASRCARRLNRRRS